MPCAAHRQLKINKEGNLSDGEGYPGRGDLLSLSPRLVRGQVESKNYKGVDKGSFFRDENR
jgi:hypothetical protein